jgi:uncharacterized membrane protein HdeD (DUF308 family)
LVTFNTFEKQNLNQMETESSSKQTSSLFILIGIKALLAIGIGLGFLINPMGMVSTFSYLLGIALLIYGVITIYNGFKIKEIESFWALIIEDGVLQVIVGIVLLAWPELTPGIIMVIIGLWIIAGGVIQMVIANKYKDGTGQRNLRGLVGIVLGGILVFNPGTSVEIFSMIIGALSLLYGIYMVFLLMRFGKTK